MAEAIAAGEVIERPASVVKELVENALDADAHRITVVITEGGCSLIRVVDDGGGISSEDLTLAFQRHATSKLSAIDDLTTLGTYGFRGEALASMAAVARVTIQSRWRHGGVPSRLEISAHGVRGPEPTARGSGTEIEVADLFRLTPARRAFLRGTKTEAAACVRVVGEAALGSPEVAFELISEGKVVLRTPGKGGLAEAARAVLGAKLAATAVPVDWASAGMRVTGLLGAPETARPTRTGIVLMVNGRRVHQRSLAAAVEGAYRGLIPSGRYPVAVVHVWLDPADVDVNVHPTKREVRFKEEGRVFEVVQRACWEALRALAPTQLSPAGPARAADFAESLPGPSRLLLEAGAPNPSWSTPQPDLSMELSLHDAAGWRYLGQAHLRYLLVETGSGIAVLDQHAAHEKVLYERALGSLQNRDRAQPSQGLLEPVLVEMGATAVAQLDSLQDFLRAVGMELEVFGATTIRCTAAPPAMRLSEVGDFLAEALEVRDQGGYGPAGNEHRLAASIACHTAVRFGDQLSPKEVAVLLADLAETAHGITCPHGRPALLAISESTLLSAFRRR